MSINSNPFNYYHKMVSDFITLGNMFDIIKIKEEDDPKFSPKKYSTHSVVNDIEEATDYFAKKIMDLSNNDKFLEVLLNTKEAEKIIFPLYLKSYLENGGEVVQYLALCASWQKPYVLKFMTDML